MAKTRTMRRKVKRSIRRTTKRSGKRQTYSQGMTIEAVPLDADTLRVDGTLDDPDHHIEVYIIVAVRTSKIIDVGARMLRQPYPTCNKAMKRAQALVGMKIERGFYEKLAVVVGGRDGCVHLIDILMASAKMAANAIIGIVVGGKNWNNLTDRDDEFHDRLMGRLEGMCIGFNRNEISRSRSK